MRNCTKLIVRVIVLNGRLVSLIFFYNFCACKQYLKIIMSKVCLKKIVYMFVFTYYQRIFVLILDLVFFYYGCLNKII